MPYDLYGTYYSSLVDAQNAEWAQMASIDADIAMRKVKELEKRLDYSNTPSADWEALVWDLSRRVEILEEKINELLKIDKS